jgi:hypothetical protein
MFLPKLYKMTTMTAKSKNKNAIKKWQSLTPPQEREV